jgi:hypothetical protein
MQMYSVPSLYFHENLEHCKSFENYETHPNNENIFANVPKLETLLNENSSFLYYHY